MANNTALEGISIPASPQANPASPDSIGALLAEEWTINQTSTLPSFLERMMMEEARKSGWKTLKSLFLVVEERISRVLEEIEIRNSNSNNTGVGGAEGKNKLFDTLFRRWPHRITKAFFQNVLRPFGPEIRFLLLYVLERSSLIYSKATISESLYGGRREKLGKPNPSKQSERRSLQPIEKSDIIRLAFFMAIGPYLEERSQSYFHFFSRLFSLPSGDQPSRAITNTTSRNSKLQIILSILWPLLRTSTKLSFFWYRWRYLLGKTIFFDPYSSWLDLVVRRVTMEDQQQQQHQSKSQTKIRDVTDPSDLKNIRIESIRKELSNLVGSSGIRLTAAGLLSSSIVLAWIARIRSIRQELQQERESHQLRQIQLRGQRSNHLANDIADDGRNGILSSAVNNKMIPPPPCPAPLRRSNSKISHRTLRNIVKSERDVCPLCNEPHIHPTASTGGFVFCLKCILTFLRQNYESCPVTGKLCPESRLVRLYEPTY